MKSFSDQLHTHLKGEVRFDDLSRKIYSVDASIFEVQPIGIILPKDREDLITALQIAAAYAIPVIPRGAATGITGGCLGKGLIIDLSKFMNRILEINIEEEYAICEPGVVQDRLNDALSSFGYRLGPDTSTGNRATLGGMLANNAAGARSLYYGRMVDCIEAVEMALTGGEIIFCHSINGSALEAKLQHAGIEGEIYKSIQKIQHKYHTEIQRRFPLIPRHVSGYNLDQILDFSSLNLSKLIAGSEGTLGIASQIKVKIAKKLAHTALCIIHLDDMIEGMKHIEEMLDAHPISLELIDRHILEMGRLSPAIKKKLGWLQGSPEAVIAAEFSGETVDEARKAANHFQADMKRLHIGYAHVVLSDPKHMNHVWEVRKAGLGLLLSKRTYNRAIAFIEDLTVAPKHLPAFMRELTSYLKNMNKDVGIYGHIGSGCMHIRPFIDLRSIDDIAQMKKIMIDVADMVLNYSGGLSGEHGDGLIRSWLNKKMFGDELYRAFVELKTAFDPKNLMNPGKIVDGADIDPKTLRMHPGITQASLPTFLDFSNEGGIALAADMCNGNGQCRKNEGVMCPSFQATGDEFDTTRARAQSLRAIINGRLPKEEFTGKALYRVLDLCLECKGCKTECPSQVDMAKMKTEFLYQYQEKHGYSLRNRLFAHLTTINRLAMPISGIYNFINSSTFGKYVRKLFAIAPQRKLPLLAKERFSDWFKRQIQEKHTKKIVLFNDTYTEFHQPEIGIAAYQILSQLGYHIILISNACCGRPFISKGLLQHAKKNAIALVNRLAPFAYDDIPIIYLEPSCFSALKDDYLGLIGSSNPELKNTFTQVASKSISLDLFLNGLIENGGLPLPFKKKNIRVIVHGHCHQKSLAGMEATLNVLRAIPYLTVHEITSGCCGLAGSFGYEQEHYELSMKIGNLHLLPAIRQASVDTVIVADGMSCRSQIEHGTQRHAVHLAELIASQIVESTL